MNNNNLNQLLSLYNSIQPLYRLVPIKRPPLGEGRLIEGAFKRGGRLLQKSIKKGGVYWREASKRRGRLMEVIRYFSELAKFS